MDARLRPGGQKGEVALYLSGFESYLARQADLWERQAYIKARPIAGDPDVASAILALTHCFVYHGPDPPDLAERILAMRQRIETERVGTGGKATHVKLGSGGILEIEFLVQYLQLRHGRMVPALQTPSALLALAALGSAGLLPASDAATLEASYRFLRRLNGPQLGIGRTALETYEPAVVYELDLTTPGSSPFSSAARKQMRHISKRRM